ncbi:hypothetical protein Cgig2_020527 [Carnegiea gigantea]|uniref:Helicase ATP-binding domain-containing protein n=1 Tax=Carnegiea gigantea TaxID=171969 RepID=A0A9Q1QFM0_9CARY|nr:hypothetical protein Cgig2_020527 [Carnegiea gigantea]
MGVEAEQQQQQQQQQELEQWKKKFPTFPYKPYSIQLDFMNSLYQFLDHGGISMLESPTGTGKTLSIICSALQWLVDRRKDWKLRKGDKCPSDDEPDWMRDFVVNKDDPLQGKKSGVQPKKKLIEAKRRTGCVDLFSGKIEGGNHDRIEKEKDGLVELDDEEFLMEEYESEGDEEGGKSKRKGNGFSISSSSEEEDELNCEGEESLKVYFCSRTHSQLSQFIKELRKTVFGSELKVVSLGSRKNLCVNEDVLRLGNPTSINERCLELQKSKKNGGSKIKKLQPGGRIRRTEASSGCPMLRKQKLQKEFVSEISQQEPLDIEDLVHLGHQLGTCPYYGSRRMAPAADLIVLPYQSLLSKSSRESLGLNLKNSVIIIDEAHNLADSLIGMYDAKITSSQLENVHQNLQKYLGKFYSRLGPGNRRYIQILMLLTRALLQAIVHGEATAHSVATSCATEKAPQAEAPSESSVAINDFLFSLNIDNINLVKVVDYVKQSNIMHKVSGYGDKYAFLEKQNPDGSISKDGRSTLSGFQALLDMLLSLTNKNVDGRIVISRMGSTGSGGEEGFIKYVMLTGEKIFSEIANQAHAVILAGGTLQPIEETRERLFPWLPPDHLHFFSCGHIVPPESILPIAVSRGPSGLPFDFSYTSRSSSKMIEELGLLLCNVVAVVPEGIVVFFSSFEYEGKVHDAWKSSGILQRITRRKHVFREPRSSADVDAVLNKYKETIHTLANSNPKGQTCQNGAVLFAVVGGKISEGINFSDGMGRCIVMVGLPYPSPSDVELIERIKHMEGLSNTSSCYSLQLPINDSYKSIEVQSGFDILRRCKRRGKEYYENLCMKAVNQSIGSYGEVHRLLHQFFRHNKST